MALFEPLQEYGYGELHAFRDATVGLQALVAIHDTRLGPALGGTRCLRYVTEHAALLDVLRLARAMTSKAALAGVPHGGGKAVILLPDGDFDRVALFTRFGRFVESLGGRYITTEDSGTGTADMNVVRGVTRHVAGFDAQAGGSGDPSPFTALGVRRGIEAAARIALGVDSLRDVHVAVQGVGNVGAQLCRELAACGATLSIADVRESVVASVAQELGARVVPNPELHRLRCDVYAPCALGGALNAVSVPELRCKVVAGAANNQLSDTESGQALHDRSILYAPDYAINAGGLINVAQEVAGYDAARARERTLAIHGTITAVCERSLAENRQPQLVADAMVAEILAAASDRV